MCILLAVKDVDWRKRLCFLTSTSARVVGEGKWWRERGNSPQYLLLRRFFFCSVPIFARSECGKKLFAVRKSLLQRLMIMWLEAYRFPPLCRLCRSFMLSVFLVSLSFWRPSWWRVDLWSVCCVEFWLFRTTDQGTTRIHDTPGKKVHWIYQ